MTTPTAPHVVVTPSGPLEGTVRVGGAKNSVLKLMAATVLAEGTHRITNVPDITDVDLMADLLRACGLAVTRGDGEVLVERPAEILPEPPTELAEGMRASTALMGPLLATCGEVRLAMPGGDDFGHRPVDLHVKGLERLGAEFARTEGMLTARVERLTGDRITLEFPSVGATENLLMAAVLAKGTTVIDNAAREPEIADLATMLNKMGARVLGAGSSTIEVEGVERLSPAEHAVVPDRIEAATFLGAVAVAGGEITIEGARPDHMEMVCQKLGDMGMRTSPDAAGLWAMSNRRLTAVNVATLPYPGIATDCKPLFVAAMTTAQGTGTVTENLFGEGRFRYIGELRQLGADIDTEGHHAVVRGVERLAGGTVGIHDIRAGAALVVAALGADGPVTLTGIDHLDRGYEHFVDKLAGIGVDIVRYD